MKDFAGPPGLPLRQKLENFRNISAITHPSFSVPKHILLRLPRNWNRLNISIIHIPAHASRSSKPTSATGAATICIIFTPFDDAQNSISPSDSNMTVYM